jgi:predicted nucleic acid-binding protein
VTLVDTNVLLDLVTNDRDWADWSLARLEDAALAGPLLINDIVYAESSIRFDRIEDLDATLATARIKLTPAPRSALFLAGKAYKQYRAAGGTRTGVLPDFFIGAHATVEGWPLLTRDTSRYRTYFPKITLIAPTT